MIVRHLETRSTSEPPVKFYKVIAVSFLLITAALLALIIFITSRKAVITIAAKEDNKNLNLTVNVAREARGLRTISGLVTSTVFQWSEKFSPTGNKVVEGKARGEVVLYNHTNASQTLVATTRLLTASGMLFRLTDRVTIPAEGQVTTTAYADQAGAASEIEPSHFTIPGLAPEKQKVIYAESFKQMRGGRQTVGVISSDDLKAAEANYREKIKDAWLATMVNNLPAVNDNYVTVANTAVSPDHKIGEEVSDFTLNGSSTLVLVSYNRQDLAKIIDGELADQINIATEKVLNIDKKPKVTVVSYDLTNGAAQLAVEQGAVVTLDADVDSLAARNFLGKKKDEIERYIMGLSHVASVEVKFSPSWMLSAPTVSDKIKVVVKNGE